MYSEYASRCCHGCWYLVLSLTPTV
jgi:hypothetical protein